MIAEIDTQRREKAASYRHMMESWPWKDFWKFVEDTRAQALESAIVSDDLKEIQMWRGYVRSIDAIKSQLDYVLEGL